MLVVRSLLFNIAFYLATVFWLLVALPAFLLPYRAIIRVAQGWARTCLFLSRTIAGIDCEVRGLEKIPPGGLLVAAKHQSAWETFGLLPLFDDPAFIVKRELRWIPIFGWFMIKGRMVGVDRGRGKEALADMVARACVQLARGRQIIIFPEGTRRPAGAEPRYKSGVAHIYEVANVPCLPVALNSGLFWPRRTFLRKPGTVIVEILDPIPPGMEKDAFFARLEREIEAASKRLIEEGRG